MLLQDILVILNTAKNGRGQKQNQKGTKKNPPAVITSSLANRLQISIVLQLAGMMALSFGRLLGFVVFVHCGEAFHMTGLPLWRSLPYDRSTALHYTNACTMLHQRLRMCVGESVSGARTVDGSGEFDPVRVVSAHDERFLIILRSEFLCMR